MDLRERWSSLLAELGADALGVSSLYGELVECYGEPARHYHVLGHIEEVRGWLDVLVRAGEGGDDPAAVELAAWFHDAVYDPTAADNEERSARLAVDRLRAIGLPEALTAEVARLVELTRTHRAGPDDTNAAALLDADLAILGAAPDDYDRYRLAIAREFAFVPEADFRRGRASLLAALANGPLYLTTILRDRLDGPARANLAREIESLMGPGGPSTPPSAGTSQ